MRLLCFLFLFFYSESAFSYVQTVSDAGVPVQWVAPFKVNLTGNFINRSGVSEGDFFSAVVKGLQRWKQTAPDAIFFDYWQGSISNIYPVGGGYDGVSSIYFASNSSSSRLTSSGVLGLTQVWYRPNEAKILEVDIELNDIDYPFTTNPTDTSGYGSGSFVYSGVNRQVYIENVITHELGHAMGLSHSAQLQSTMLFVESPEQAHLGCDEWNAGSSIYGGVSTTPMGALGGKVLSPTGSPIFGAYVQAISRQRGTVMASAITNKNGDYVIRSLEEGTYYVMVEPHYASPQVLPAYYSSIQSRVCFGSYFSRTFLLNGSSDLYPVTVRSGNDISPVPQIVVRCNSFSDNYTPQKIVFDGQSGQSGFGFLSLGSGLDKTYQLASVSGNLEIHAMSFSLYSPVVSQVSLEDQNGNPVPVNLSKPIYSGDSGYANYDLKISAQNLQLGNYTLRVSVSYLNPTLYPAGSIALDRSPFLVLLGTVNEGVTSLSKHFPYNARCRSDEVFSSYSSPLGLPQKQNVNTDSTGFCGTLERIEERDDSKHPSVGAIVGWLMPFFTMFMWRRLTCMQRRKRLI